MKTRLFGILMLGATMFLSLGAYAQTENFKQTAGEKLGTTAQLTTLDDLMASLSGAVKAKQSMNKCAYYVEKDVVSNVYVADLKDAPQKIKANVNLSLRTASDNAESYRVREFAASDSESEAAVKYWLMHELKRNRQVVLSYDAKESSITVVSYNPQYYRQTVLGK